MSDHNCHEHFEHGSVEKDNAETIQWIGSCTVCGKALVEVYDYQGTYDPDADTWLFRMMDEATRQLHDLLSTVVARGRTGEWREAVAAKQELDKKLHALIAKE